jgi:hypothetical protein
VEDYDPSLYWVSKIREEGRVAVYLFIYMDDLRPMGPAAEECWRTARKGAATCNHLGIKDAPRKRRAASKMPPPWPGSMIYTDNEEAGLRVLVARKKWCKAKHLLANLDALLKESEMVDHKVLERNRGFLVYVARTYKPTAPFLLGFHLTIDSWRPGLDEEGWRLRQAEVEASLESYDESDTEEGHGGEERAPPRLVLAVPRLRDDLNVLIQLTEAEAPPLRRVRAIRKANILYGFGDSSGSGFGWCIDFGEGVRYELGEWCDKTQEAFLNYRELWNLANAMLRAAQEGRLDGCEVFLYMDNQTAEGSYF